MVQYLLLVFFLLSLTSYVVMLSMAPLCAMFYKVFDFILLCFFFHYTKWSSFSSTDTAQKFYWELVHINHLTLPCIHYLISWCSFGLKIVLSVISHLFGFVLWICIGYFCRCFKQCAWSRFCKFLPGVLGAVSLKTCGFDFLVIESQWAGRLFLVPFLIAMYLHFSYP